MQKVEPRQAFFVIIMAILFFFVLGALVVTNVQAQGLALGRWQDWEWDDDWDRAPDKTLPDFRYNRVEGLYMGVKVDPEYWRYRRPTSPFIYGSAGYSFAMKDVEYQVGFEQGLFRKNRAGLGVEYHHLVDTPDRWRVGEEENSLAAFLIKEDFQDYYQREGGSVYYRQEFLKDLMLKVGYHFEQYDSLERNAKWSMFGKSKKFRDNPAMDAGDIRAISGRFTLDTRNSNRRTTRGWYVNLDYEHATTDMGSDWTYDRFEADFRRYQPLGFDQGLDIRLRVGTSYGDLPWQKSYQLGGISTLRAFRYKSLSGGYKVPGGNRMILAQIEYRLGEESFASDLDLGFFELFNFILFADAGWVGAVDPDFGLAEGFDNLRWGDFKSDIGVALANRSGSVRIEVARRTDTSHKPFRMYFRITRPF